jgi:hypothetical protein
MKTFLMVVATNVLIVAFMALASSLWSLIGAVVGYGNSWWLAPLASFAAFLIAGRFVRDADRDVAFRAQYAIFGVFCAAVLVASLLGQNLGIPAWRIVLTLILLIAGTWLGRAVLGRPA